MTYIPKAMDAIDGAIRPILEVEFEPDIRYVWVDEDSRRVSPLHRDFGKALTWFQNWPSWKLRIDRQEARENDRLDHSSLDSEWLEEQRDELRIKIARARRDLTLTGKPPMELKRIVMSSEVADISDSEVEVVNAIKKTAQV